MTTMTRKPNAAQLAILAGEGCANHANHSAQVLAHRRSNSCSSLSSARWFRREFTVCNCSSLVLRMQPATASASSRFCFTRPLSASVVNSLTALIEMAYISSAVNSSSRSVAQIVAQGHRPCPTTPTVADYRTSNLLILRVPVDDGSPGHGRGREFESRRPRHSFQVLSRASWYPALNIH